MGGQVEQFRGWESQAQIDASLEELGVSQTQMTRWRRNGLLPEVKQYQHAYRGSEIFYPPGTCRQIAAAQGLFNTKNDIAYVGRELWWQGFEVDDRHWRPWLLERARKLDVYRPIIGRLLDRDTHTKTIQERLASDATPDPIASKVKRRTDYDQLAAVYRVVLEISVGRFDGFEPRREFDKRSPDEDATILALDIGDSEKHAILGRQLKLTKALRPTLVALARAFQTTSLQNVVDNNSADLFQARDDVRNTLRIAAALYLASNWIYGPRALGLRLAAWMAEKRPANLMPMLVLGFTQLRRTSNELLLSSEISKLADLAEQARDDSLKIQALWKSDRRFKNVFSPKRIRKGFRDEPSYRNWCKEIAIARDSESSNN